MAQLAAHVSPADDEAAQTPRSEPKLRRARPVPRSMRRGVRSKRVGLSDIDWEARFRSDLIGYVPRLRAFARTLAGDYAHGEDLAQEAVMRAWRARDSFTPGTNMEAWLFRILRNQHISRLRQSKRAVEEDLELSSWRLAGPDDPSAGVLINDLRQAMNRLPPEQREALVLVGAAGWSYEEAAAYVECPVGTMKSRVFRARRALADLIAEGRVLRDSVRAGDAMGKLLRRAAQAETARAALSPQEA